MQKLPFVLTGLIAVTMLLTAGCGTARRGALYGGPLEIESPQVRKGQQVFMRHCHQCHPGGTAGVGPALNNKPLPGFLIKFQVRHGLGAMPAFSEEHISSEELDALVAYLKALRRSD